MRTNNYLGKHDENRGIVLFVVFLIILAIIFGIMILLNSKDDEDVGVSKADNIASIVEKKQASINNMKIEDGKLLLEGEIKDAISSNLIIKLQNVEIVLKSKDGDKYVFGTDYFVSSEKIDFSSILEDKKESEIDLEAIEKGEYFVLLRLKTESPNDEKGYKYRYYTLNNLTDSENLEYNSIKIYFDKSKLVSSYLTIEK